MLKKLRNLLDLGENCLTALIALIVVIVLIALIAFIAFIVFLLSAELVTSKLTFIHCFGIDHYFNVH